MRPRTGNRRAPVAKPTARRMVTADMSVDHRPPATGTGVRVMSSFVGFVPIGVVIVAILFGSAMLAMVAAHFLPPQHLSAETKGVVSVSVAVVGTMSALVIGLLISNSSASFTSKTQEVTQISTDVINLDRVLRRYGPETRDMRAMLHRYAEAKMHNLFPKDPSQGTDLENGTTLGLLEQLQDKIYAHAHEPGAALGAGTGSGSGGRDDDGRLALGAGERGPDFAPSGAGDVLVRHDLHQGLFAPSNGTAITMVFLSSVAIGGAIRMTTELQIHLRALSASRARRWLTPWMSSTTDAPACCFATRRRHRGRVLLLRRAAGFCYAQALR